MNTDYRSFQFEYFSMGSKRRRLLDELETAIESSDRSKMADICELIQDVPNMDAVFYGAVWSARCDDKLNDVISLMEKAPKGMWAYGTAGEQLPFTEISQYNISCVQPNCSGEGIYKSLSKHAEKKAVENLKLYFQKGCPTSLRNRLNTTLLTRAVRSKSVDIVKTVLEADRAGERYFYNHPAYALPAYLESAQNNTPEISKLLEKEFCFQKMNEQQPKDDEHLIDDRQDDRVGVVGSTFALAGIVALILTQCHSTSETPDQPKKTASVSVIKHHAGQFESQPYYHNQCLERGG